MIRVNWIDNQSRQHSTAIALTHRTHKNKNHDAAEQPLGEAKTCIFIPLVLDLAGSEGLPGPHANSGPPRTSQCH